MFGSSRQRRYRCLTAGAGKFYARSLYVCQRFAHAQNFGNCPRRVVGRKSAIVLIVFTSLLRLDARALPSRSRKPAGARLDRALCFLGISYHFLCYCSQKKSGTKPLFFLCYWDQPITTSTSCVVSASNTGITLPLIFVPSTVTDLIPLHTWSGFLTVML